MHFQPTASLDQFHVYMRKFIGITGWDAWRKRCQWLRQQEQVPEYRHYYLPRRFALELELCRYLRHRKSTGRYPTNVETDSQQRFISFVIMTVKCYERLSSVGKNRVRGMLRDSLNMGNQVGLAPFAYEMRIAAHLMNTGCSVEFSDIECGGGADFIATNADLSFEVECKYISGDIGRKVHLKKFLQLAIKLRPSLEPSLETVRNGVICRVKIPDRLTGNQDESNCISELLTKALLEGCDIDTNGRYSLEISKFDPKDSPLGNVPVGDVDLADFQSFLLEKAGIDNRNTFVIIRPGIGAIVLVVESKKKDRVLYSVFRELKDAARKQLSVTKPGILCCELVELREEELEELARLEDRPNDFQLMVSNVIMRRPQLVSLSFTTSGRLSYGQQRLGQFEVSSFSEVGKTYTMINIHHELANDERLRMFTHATRRMHE